MEVKKTNHRIVIVLSLIALGFAITSALNQNDSIFKYSNQIDIEGELPAPDISLPNLSGEIISLSDLKGKVVLINVWATWCPPCVYEMPSMEELFQQFKSENFKILAVSIDSLGARAVVPFMKKHKLNFEVLIDPTGTIMTAYGVNGIPQSFVVDKRGNIVKKIIGPIDWATPEVFRYLIAQLFFCRFNLGADRTPVSDIFYLSPIPRWFPSGWR